MKKSYRHTRKKLSLHRETLHELALIEVEGGTGTTTTTLTLTTIYTRSDIFPECIVV